MKKLSCFILTTIVTVLFTVELRADGSPVVQALIARGDYLFIRVNTGLCTVHEKDGLFHWDFDHEVYAIYDNPDGMVCTLSATNYVTEILTSPEGKVLPLDENTRIAYPFPIGRDEDGYCYILTETRPHEDGYFTQLWSDRGGEWEVIATGGDFNIDDVAVSDGLKPRVWGSNGRTYLAFVREGRWVELALLPPEADAPDPDGNSFEYEFLLENCDDSEGMALREICDPSGNVNVRSRPEAEAPVIAVILKDVQFFRKETGNEQWSKVLLPSGTVGYVLSAQIYQY